jgi:hypothetical protein
MTSKRRGWSAAALVASGALLALAPSTAIGETRTYFDATPLFPVGGAGNFGPANEYPSTIPVSGVAGTVTDVEVTLFDVDSGNADDADAVLVGPNGAKVMLLSDVCGDQGMSTGTWTFDDDAPTFLSNNGPCNLIDEQRFMPSNYVGNDGVDDNLGVAPGGPAPPYVNSMAALAGGSPNGDWKLFMFDDHGDISGFSIDGWGLRLEVTPPPPTPPTPPPPAPPAPPANTAKPVLTGKAKSGKTLTCAPGAWTGATSLAFAWLRNGDAIAGAGAETLTLARRDAGKAIQCEVTATGAGGTGVEQSKPVVPKKARRR